MIHDVLVSAFWPGQDAVGPNEYRDVGLVGSAAARPFQTAFGQELHEGLFDKAAALFHSLIANHPFHNGNKRTAVIALDHFLLANGYFLLLDNASMYNLAKETATYRERGLMHDEIFRHIKQTVEGASVSLIKIKPRLSAELYERILESRRLIRGHHLNQNQPGDPISPSQAFPPPPKED